MGNGFVTTVGKMAWPRMLFSILSNPSTIRSLPIKRASSAILPSSVLFAAILIFLCWVLSRLWMEIKKLCSLCVGSPVLKTKNVMNLIGIHNPGNL